MGPGCPGVSGCLWGGSPPTPTDMSSREKGPESPDATVIEITGDAPTPEPESGPVKGPFFLIVTGAPSPSSLGQVIPLTSEAYLIGRGRGADLRLEDSGLSREHARIVREATGGHAVLDLRSTNGTYLNGVRVERAALGEGDRIQMGMATSLRYSARARLQPREEQVRRALSASGVGTWEWLPQHRRLVLSEDAEQLLGLGKQASADPMSLLHEEDRERVRQAFQAALDSGACDVECRSVSPEGTVRWISLRGELFRGDDGSPARLAGALLDVTAQREATSALRRQALIFESISDGLVVLDADGFILDWNPGAERMLGFPRSEAEGHAPEELPGLGWPEAVTRELIQAVASEGRWRAELTLHRRGGGECTAEVAALPLHDAQGGLFATVVVCRDVGERRRIEAHLQIADRLAGLWRLSAGLSHQLNNPLAALSANLGWVLAELGHLRVERSAAMEIEGVLEEMAQSLRQIGAVVRDLGMFSGSARAEEPRPVDVNHVVELVLRIADGDLRSRAKVRRRLGEVPPVLGSEARLGQAVQNVVVEAAHRFDPGQVGRNEIEIATSLDGTDVAITVMDNAPPLSGEDLAHLFDPFYRIEIERPGSSLALSVALGLVKDGGGTIAASSSGAGNVFRISLPALAAP